MPFEEDEFIFDDENDEDVQLTIIEEEKLKILDKMEEYLKLVKESIKFQEKQDEENNFMILADSIDKMIKLNMLEKDPDTTEDDIFKAIKEINLSHDQLTFSNMEEYAQDFREINGLDELNQEDQLPISDEPDLSDDDFDF